MKKKIFIIFNIIMFALILIADYFYTTEWNLLTKGIASGLFVLQAVGNLIYVLLNKKSPKYAIWLVVSLIIAMLGDIYLNLDFITGAVIFGIGHIFFFISYSQISKISWKDFIIGAIIFVISLLIILFLPVLKFNDKILQILCICYAFIISFMVGKALSNLLNRRNKQNIIILLGSILFFVSDFMLLLYNFGNINFALYLCLVAYYPAQSLIANSSFYCEEN